MFAAVERDIYRLRDPESENMFGVLCCSRLVAMTPTWKDVVDVLDVPVRDAPVFCGVDPGSLPRLARRCFGERLAGCLAAGHRLPGAGGVGSFHQQHVE